MSAINGEIIVRVIFPSNFVTPHQIFRDASNYRVLSNLLFHQRGLSDKCFLFKTSLVVNYKIKSCKRRWNFVIVKNHIQSRNLSCFSRYERENTNKRVATSLTHQLKPALKEKRRWKEAQCGKIKYYWRIIESSSHKRTSH